MNKEQEIKISPTIWRILEVDENDWRIKFDNQVFDEEGYNKEGWNQDGYDRAGYSKRDYASKIRYDASGEEEDSGEENLRKVLSHWDVAKYENSGEKVWVGGWKRGLGPGGVRLGTWMEAWPNHHVAVSVGLVLRDEKDNLMTQWWEEKSNPPGWRM